MNDTADYVVYNKFYKELGSLFIVKLFECSSLHIKVWNPFTVSPENQINLVLILFFFPPNNQSKDIWIPLEKASLNPRFSVHYGIYFLVFRVCSERH